MTGLLFAPPGQPLAKAEILPRLNDFHYRSGEHIDFYCAGYAWWHSDMDDYRTTGTDGVVYSAPKFDAFRRDIARRSRWRYSGETDLLILNSRYDREAETGMLDFSSAIVCKLDTMKSDGAITSAGLFFERIFQYSESATGDDPTWGFSDSLAGSSSASALKRFVLALLPKELGKDISRIAHFAVTDVSQQAT